MGRVRIRYFVVAGLLALPWYFLLSRGVENNPRPLLDTPPIYFLAVLELTLLSAALIMSPAFFPRSPLTYWLLPPSLFLVLCAFFIIWLVLIGAVWSLISPPSQPPPPNLSLPSRMIGSAGFAMLLVFGFLYARWPLAILLLALTYFSLLAASWRSPTDRA